MQIGSKVKSGYRPDPKINKILDPNPDRTGSGPGSGKTRIFLGPGLEKKIKLWTGTRTRKKDKILDPDPQLPSDHTVLASFSFYYTCFERMLSAITFFPFLHVCMCIIYM